MPLLLLEKGSIEHIIIENIVAGKKSRHRLRQGSQTQIDSGAASDSKKGLAGRIEKSEKNYLRIFSFKLNIDEKSRQNVLKFFQTPNFFDVRGPRV